MITEARFQNLKSLRDVTVRLGKLNLIIGPNASGKTTILHGLHWISQLGRISYEKVFSGPRSPELLVTSGVSAPIELSAKVLTAEAEGEVAFRQNSAKPVFTPFGGPEESFDATLSWPGKPEQRISGKSLAPDHQSVTVRHPVLDAIHSAVFLKFELSKLAQPNGSGEQAFVRHDGFGLAITLATLKLQRDEAFNEIESQLKTVVRTVKRVRIHNEQMNTRPQDISDFSQASATVEPAYRILFDFQSAKNLPASAASEGTLLTLGLLTALSADTRPRLVLIDELERGLHPRALAEVVKHLRAMVAADPGLQIVATTHSPYLANEFEADEIILTDLAADGSARVAKLSHHPDFDKWKDEMKAGEFWSMVGEKWIGQGATRATP